MTVTVSALIAGLLVFIGCQMIYINFALFRICKALEARAEGGEPG